MSHVRYEIADIITLFAVADKFPGAFVGAGVKGRKFFCVDTLLINESFMDAFEAERVIAVKGVWEALPIILYPTWEDAQAMQWEMADVACQCKKLLRNHGVQDERRDDRPDGVVPAQLQERGANRPGGKRRRKAHR